MSLNLLVTIVIQMENKGLIKLNNYKFDWLFQIINISYKYDLKVYPI